MKKKALFQALLTKRGLCLPPTIHFSRYRTVERLLFVFALLFSIHERINAQCNVTAVVENGNIIFSVPSQFPTTFTWTSSISPFTGTGNTFSIPIPSPFPAPPSFNITLTGSDDPNHPCFKKTVTLANGCFETTTFSSSVNGCTVAFTPDNSSPSPVISRSWNFGDGTLSHESSPSHTYAPPGGVFQVTLATIISYPTTWGIFFCTKPVTTACSVLCGTPPDPGYTTMEFFDCCQLKVSFSANCNDCQHTWQFGSCGTSSEISPVFTVQNMSTYAASEGGTPTIPIVHTIICPGQQAVTQTTSYTFLNKGIFVGTPGSPAATISLKNVVSCQNGAKLFPNSSLANPTTWNIYCYSTLNIDKPYTFNKDHICMDPCTGINILSNNTLTFNDNNVVENGPGCAMWRGIQVATVSGQLVVTGHSVIRDAMVGVQPMGTTSIVRLSGATFINNFVGLAANTPFQLQGATYFNDNIFKGEGTMDPACGSHPGFIDAGYSPKQPYAGVFLRNSSLNIPTGLVNTFSHMANGIKFYDSNGTNVKLCNFDNMTTDGFTTSSGNGIWFFDGSGGHQLVHTGGTFDNCVRGIFDNVTGPGNKFRSIGTPTAPLTMTNVQFGYKFDVSGSIVPFSATSQSRVTGATITSTRVGLEFNVIHPVNNPAGTSASNQLNVQSNTFNATSGHGVVLRCDNDFVLPQNVNVGGAGNLLNTIHVNGSDATPTIGVWANNFSGGTIDNNNIDKLSGTGAFFRGISLDLGAGTTVQFNNVTGNFAGAANNFSDGIYTENSATNIYFDNAFANTFVGMRFNGNCQMENNIDCNSMTNHQVGMRYIPSGSASMPTTTDPQNCGLNTWDAGITQGAVYDGLALEASISKYFTLPPPSLQRPNSVSPAGWFVDGSCTETCPPNFVGNSPNISETDGLIGATGSSMGDANEAGINYLYKRQLYRKLRANPALVSQSASMQSFKAANDNQPVGLLYNVEEQLRNAFQLTATQHADLNTLSDEISTLLSGLEAIDAALEDANLNQTQIDQYAAQREGKASQLEAKYASVSTIYDQWMAQRNSASAAIVAANNAISTVGDYDGNEKSLNAIYANKVLKGLPLDWQDKEKILAIAKQCPKKGGAAIYWARAWYATLEGVEVQEEDCVIGRSSEGAGNQPVANSPEYKLYPNPANNVFTIAGPSVPEGENWTISLYSGLGQLMGSFAYSVDGRTEVPLKNIPTGIYWCRVLNGEQQLVTQKISVIK